jgi:polysaccharide export outer membrane protein
MSNRAMRGTLTRTLISAFLLVLTLAFGQDPGYRLQPEDVIRIQVYNETQIGGEFEINKDGTVSAPFVGIIQAAGKTTTQLEQELKELYIEKLRIRDPIVSVTISRYRVMRASVTGFVQRAGAYPFRQGETIATLLSLAGGPVFDQADLKRARLRRAGSSEEIPIDLEAMLQLGDTSQNYQLQDGDELIVPQDRENRIVVWGAVQQPGTFPYQKGMRVTDALGFSRGEIRNVTKASEITVFRRSPGQTGRYVPIRVNIVRFWNKHDYTQNIALEKGDVLYVPSTKTPNVSDIAGILNAAFFADRVLGREGIFGFRPFGFIGR